MPILLAALSGINPVRALRIATIGAAMALRQGHIKLCRTADVENGGALKVEVRGLVLAVFNLNGEFFVTDDACTHGPGSLADGFLSGDVVECNFHGGQFNVRTGEVVSPPCMIPVRTYPVTLENGMVLIEAPD
jgi:nitrite reductase/ring-hydroxylating ferredoxin subunit